MPARPLLPVLCLLLAAGCDSPPPDLPAGPEDPDLVLGFDPADLDATVRPQDDFYGYVNNRWLDRTAIPPEWPSYGAIQILTEQTEAQLRALIETGGTASQDPGLRKIGALYASFMDEAAVSRLGTAPLAAELRRIDALRTHDDVIRYMGYALQAGVQVPVDYYVSAHAADPDRNLVYLWQGGLGLPDRDYYLLESEEFGKIRAGYLTHIERLFGLAGWPDGAAAASSIVELETRLAERHWSRVQNRDTERIVQNRYTVAGAKQLTPALDWPAYLEAAGFTVPGEFVIAQTEYFQALGGIIHAAPVANWQVYLRFKLLKAYAPYLNDAIVNEDFAFQGKVLRGQEQIKARWQRGVRLVNEALGELAGRAYVEEHFPPAAKERVDALIGALRTACGETLRQLDWMSPPTRAAALAKLEKFTAKIGYPSKWRDYSALEIRPDDLVGNVRRAREFEHRYQAGKLTRPVDRTEWGMTPQTVNAYYRPSQNEIVFPAAILQPPFFDPASDDAVNFGAIGAIIGHEISHGFDDQGRKFDGDGRLRDWWTAEDADKYHARAAVLVKQYSAFAPLPDLHINGELTLGENIADLAGLVIAYRAYRLSLGGKEPPLIAGFTGDQRFFISYALAWRGKFRDEMLREMLLSRPHPPYRYRAQGVLQNMPEFYAAFGVQEGDAMYLSPGERARIW
jgi:predicted metalloendopeptidase